MTEPTISPQQKTGYLSSAKTAYFGFIMTIPLFLIYEIGTLLTGATSRNGAEVWFFLNILELVFHKWTLLAVGIIYTLVLLIIILLHKRNTNRSTVRRYYWAGAFIEAFIYSWLLAPIINLLMSTQIGVGEAIVTSCGAGFFEELVFRVLLFWGITSFITKIFDLKKASILIILIMAVFSSIIFSAVHHLSPNDPFDLVTFIFRFLAGMIFCVLYFFRGFGIAAWTHALYDVWVMTGVLGAVLGY